MNSKKAQYNSGKVDDRALSYRNLIYPHSSAEPVGCPSAPTSVTVSVNKFKEKTLHQEECYIDY